MQIYSQNDQQWKNTKIGYDTGPNDTIGNYGCYMTAIANVCSWAGNELTPKQINEFCIQNGWLVSSDLISRDDVPSLLCSNLVFNGKTSWHDATSMNFFDDASDPNIAYIICIDASNAPGIQTHFVMVEKTLGNGDLQIADSWDGVVKSLSHYGNPSVIIQSATKFTRTNPIETTASVAVDAKYQVTETYPDNKQIQLNKQPTNLWGMNYADPGALPPVEVHNQGEIFTDISNKVHHQNGYDYYRRADQVDGFNVLDCDDYTPPPPAPYVPPAAPEVAPAAQKYTVKATVMYFGSAEDAQFKKNALGTIPPSKDYYIFEIANSVVNLGKDNMHAQYWINTKDNVVPVVVKEAPKPPAKVLLPSQVKPGTQDDKSWKSSYKSFHSDRHSDLYEVRQHVTMLDYSGKRNPVALQPGDKLNVPGHFVKDGVMFYRTRSGRDEYFSWFYGVSLYDDFGNIQMVKVVETDPAKIERRISDYLHYWKDDIKDIMDIFILRKKKK